MSRFARMRDRNEPAIMEAFVRAGCTVLKLSGPVGSPDLCVGFMASDVGYINLLVEVKSPAGAKGGTRNEKGQHLSPKQEKWHQEWGGQVAIVRSPDEAVALVRQYRPVHGAGEEGEHNHG